MSTVLAPLIGENKVKEMLSEETPIETKGWAARWYAEMLVELFLSDEAKQRNDRFQTLSLGDKIKEITNDTSKEIVDYLYTIENIGNQATHFNLNRKLNETEIKKAIEMATGLFDLILIDQLKNGGLAKTYSTARLFSTLLPSIRVNVLQSLVNTDSFNSEYDCEVLHKYLLALVKNNQRDKARRFLNRMLKNKLINQPHYKFEEKSINAISDDLTNLPIAKRIEDCKRNFNNVLATLSDEEKHLNKKLIKTISTMLDKVTPSEMGDFVGDKIILI